MAKFCHPPFSTHNRDIFERLLPTPFPQVGDILSEEEDSESVKNRVQAQTQNHVYFHPSNPSCQQVS